MACHDSSRSPQPRSGSMAPATVYVTVSMSGLMASPCSTMSSPVLTMAVTSAGGTTFTIPLSRRAAPTPPASTAARIVLPALGLRPGRSGSDAAFPAPVASGDGPLGPGARCIADARSGDALELPLEQGEVGVDHQVDQASERGLRLPAQLAARLGGVAHQQVDLRRPEELLVHDHVLLPVEPHAVERELAELAHRVGLAGGDHVVVGRVLLEHQPHGLDVVAGVTPVALGLEVPEAQLVGEPELDAGGAVGDLAGHELEAAPRPFVVEQDAAGGVEVVRLAVVDRDPVAVDLGNPVGRAGVEGCRLPLGRLHHLAEHLAGRRLVEADVGV